MDTRILEGDTEPPPSIGRNARIISGPALDLEGQLRALEIERRDLQKLVCYLLKKNEDLRRQLKRGDQEYGFSYAPQNRFRAGQF